jgi:hypothetical protein
MQGFFQKKQGQSADNLRAKGRNDHGIGKNAQKAGGGIVLLYESEKAPVFFRKEHLHFFAKCCIFEMRKRLS